MPPQVAWVPNPTSSALSAWAKQCALVTCPRRPDPESWGTEAPWPHRPLAFLVAQNRNQNQCGLSAQTRGQAPPRASVLCVHGIQGCCPSAWNTAWNTAWQQRRAAKAACCKDAVQPAALGPPAWDPLYKATPPAPSRAHPGLPGLRKASCGLSNFSQSLLSVKYYSGYNFLNISFEINSLFKKLNLFQKAISYDTYKWKLSLEEGGACRRDSDRSSS